MKLVILSLLVVLVVSQIEALRCNCGGKRSCPSPVETCRGRSNVCASIIIYAESPPREFKGCIKSNECMILNRSGMATALCCETDLCNS
uniref:UPAR/Ly6 domain-containing protein n=1 Tax=Lates calcarifer TaxID=8187 RepID=A0A4W6BLD8_LATCA